MAAIFNAVVYSLVLLVPFVLRRAFSAAKDKRAADKMGNIFCCFPTPKPTYRRTVMVAHPNRQQSVYPKSNNRTQHVVSGKTIEKGSQKSRTNAQPKPKAKGNGCGACGESDHATASCRYSTRLCFHCREEGHIIRVCPTRKREKKLRHGTQHFRGQPNALVVARPYQNYKTSMKNGKLQPGEGIK